MEEEEEENNLVQELKKLKLKSQNNLGIAIAIIMEYTCNLCSNSNYNYSRLVAFKRKEVTSSYLEDLFMVEEGLIQIMQNKQHHSLRH